MIDWLRPHPHRGDVIAAGAVPLAIAAFVIDLRMAQWSAGARFLVVGVITALLLSMAWLCELEDESPRPYHSLLLGAGLLPLVLTLILLDELIGASHPPGPGGQTWVWGVAAVVAWGAARRANSGISTLIAALCAAVAVEEFVVWVFRPSGLGTFRAILVVLAVAYALGAVRLRDSRRRHAVQLINAAGLLTLVLAFTYVEQTLFLTLARSSTGLLTAFGGSVGAPFGWKLYTLAVGFGLVAYAGADREPGPAYIGVALLAAFALLVGLPVSDHGSLIGWPLFLLIVGAGGLAIGLRPRRPLPPPPAGGAADTMTVGLDRTDER